MHIKFDAVEITKSDSYGCKVQTAIATTSQSCRYFGFVCL